MAEQEESMGGFAGSAALRLRVVLPGLCALLCVFAALAGDEPAKRPHRGVHAQMTAAEFLAKRYPYASSIGLAIAVVPDPLVPRYRRLYDLSVKTIELGMLRDNYVLDRYSFPWSRDLQQDTALSTSATATVAPAAAPAAVPDNADRSGYGVMVFRCDSWRGDVCGFPEQMSSPKPGERQSIEKRTKSSASTQLRVLYIVTDTATQGVAKYQLRCAVERVLQQVPHPGNTEGEALTSETECPRADDLIPKPSAHPPVFSLLAYPDSRCPISGSKPSVVVLGPNFSGAMDSVGEAMSGLPEFENPYICLVSSSTTDTTNERIGSRYDNVSYRRLALSDRSKIAHIARLARRAGFEFDPTQPGFEDHRHRNVAVLAESSTFGYGACHPPPPDIAEVPQAAAREEYGLALDFCRFARIVYFPATIADIRFGLQKQQAQLSNELATATKQVQGDQHLSLENGAENGSEFPESQESLLTSASDQLQLDRALDELAKLAPRLIIVVATDVRDRLFLFDQLRARLPRALLIDLEADNLLTHPDILHASRGALAVASADLIAHEGSTFGCESQDELAVEGADTSIAPWSTDAQGLLADAVARLHDSDEPKPPPPCIIHSAPRQAVLQVVTFNGFKPMSNPFPSPTGAPARGEKLWWRHTQPALFTTAEIYAPIFCLLLPWVWLRPQIRRRWSALPVRPIEFVMALLTWPALLCLPLFIIVAIVAYNSTLQTSHSLTYIVMAMEVAGLWGLWRCDHLVQLCSGPTQPPKPKAAVSEFHFTPPTPWLPAVLSVGAVLLAAAPLFWSSRRGSGSSIVDEIALIALGFNASAGIAFFLVLALATLVLLSTSAGLATGVWISDRNLRMWTQACAHDPANRGHPYSMVSSWTSWAPAGLVILLTIPGLKDNLGGARLTIFDPFASEMTIWALSATTLCSAILLCVALGVVHRIKIICGYVRCRIHESRVRTGAAPAKKIPGKWVGSKEMPMTFPATPILARVSGGGAYGAGYMDGSKGNWSDELAGLLIHGKAEDSNRLALYILLASEMSLFRWAAAGAAACALASVGFVYLYPIEADPLLLLCLAMLASIGILCAYVATSFERNEVLSHVLCNRPKETQVSTGLFIFIAAPFIVFAAAISIVAIPGVVDWAGGVLAMMRTVGVHP